MKRKKWIYIRDHDSDALAEFRRAESQRGESYQELPESARLAASLCAPFPRTGYCSHERANHNSNNNPFHLSASSHNEPLFVSLLGVRVVCSTRDTCSPLAVFSIFVIILFLLSYLPVVARAVGTFFWKLHERITSLLHVKCIARDSFTRDIIWLIQLTRWFFDKSSTTKDILLRTSFT